MLRCLSTPHATVLGANTADEERWGGPERSLHATLALLFQLLLGRPELQPRRLCTACAWYVYRMCMVYVWYVHGVCMVYKNWRPTAGT